MAVWAVAGAFAVAGGEAIRRRGRSRRGDHRVFILEYHDVGPDGDEREGVVSASRLRRHLRFLGRRYRIVSLAEAVAALGAPGGLREDLVVITFDDGYAGNYEHAWPVLRDERVPATIFVTTGFLDGRELWFDLADRCLDAATSEAVLHAIDDPALRRALGPRFSRDERAAVRAWLKTLPAGRRDAVLDDLRRACMPRPSSTRPLRWAQVRELRDAGIEIGCHTVSHPILSTLPASEQLREVTEARDRIAEELGSVPRFFAYPNGASGDFTDETMHILREAGFAAACTTVRGSNAPSCDPLRLGRIGVGAEPCAVLAARLSGLLDETIRTRLHAWREHARAR